MGKKVKGESHLKKLIALLITVYPAAVMAAVPVQITAQQVSGNVETHVEASGGVVVKYQDVTIKGDRAYYDRTSGIIRVWGNVEIEEKPAHLFCRELVYNLNTKRAVLTEVHGYLSPTDRIKADRIERISEKEWIAYDGEYTPCSHTCPDWSVSSRKFKVLLGESFSGRWVAFKVKEIPILVTPYLSGPIQKKRKSGLLVPRVGYMSNDGFVYRQPIYLVLGRSADLTLTPEERTINGKGLQGEFRYVLGKENRGNINYYQLNKKERKDWKLNFYHTYTPSDYTYFKTDVNVVSSRTYYTSSSSFNVEEQTQLYTKSTITGSKLWERAILNVNSIYFRYLNGSTDTAYQKLPNVNFYLMDTPLPKTPLTFDFNSDVTYFYRKAGGSGYRINAIPALKYSKKIGTAKNTSKLSYLLTSYQQGGSRHIWEFKNTTEVNRYFRRGKYSFSINPRISFFYRESKEQDSNPFFDITDRLKGERILTPEVELFVYSPKGRTARISLASDYSLTRQWESLVFNTDTSPADWLNLSETLLFNPSNGRLHFSNTYASVKLPFNTNLWSNYYRQNVPEEISYLRWGFSFPVNRFLSFSYQQRYDLHLSEDRERQYSLWINRGCWTGNISYRWIKNYNNTVDYQILLQINLLKLGSYGYRLTGRRD